jgi:hypothetical protein
VGVGAGAGVGVGAGAGEGGGFLPLPVPLAAPATAMTVDVLVLVDFFVLPPIAAISCSDKVPMPSRSALRAAKAGRAVRPIAKASTNGLSAGASFPPMLLLWVSTAKLPGAGVVLVTIRHPGICSQRIFYFRKRCQIVVPVMASY